MTQAGAGNRVLIVDDDDAIREVLRQLLSDEGYETVTASDGAAALQALRRAARPDLVLLDLMMPGITGWSVARSMAADPTLRDIPVIIISAMRPPPPYPATAARVLTKPIDLDTLLETVRECLE